MNFDVFTTLAGTAGSTTHPHRRTAGISFTYAPDYLRLRGATGASRVWISAHTRRGMHVRGHWRDTT